MLNNKINKLSTMLEDEDVRNDYICSFMDYNENRKDEAFEFMDCLKSSVFSAIKNEKENKDLEELSSYTDNIEEHIETTLNISYDKLGCDNIKYIINQTYFLGYIKSIIELYEKLKQELEDLKVQIRILEKNKELPQVLKVLYKFNALTLSQLDSQDFLNGKLDVFFKDKDIKNLFSIRKINKEIIYSLSNKGRKLNKIIIKEEESK